LFYAQLVEQLRATPGVRAATAASSVPFGDGAQTAAMEVEAHPTPPGSEPAMPHLTAVGDDYFNVLGLSLVKGRLLSASDRAGTVQVGVIDEEAARRLWPTENAIGQRIRHVWNRDWITIVGIVSNVRRDSMSSVSQPSLYVPLAQSFARRMRVIVATDGDVRQATQLIRSAVMNVDPDVPVSGVESLDELVAGSASRTRFAALLLSLFSGVALLLGAVGIYGVLAASVARRTREFGVRMALGATSGQVLRMVLTQSARITGIGIIAGLLGVFWTGAALRGMLFGVTTMDASVLAMVVVVLAAVTVVSSAIPARRATRVDPIIAIRTDS
jgi:predicted permease